MGEMDEIGLAQKFLNLFLLMGVVFGFFYGLIYCTFWLAVAVLGRLLEQPDDDASLDASFFDVD